MSLDYASAPTAGAGTPDDAANTWPLLASLTAPCLAAAADLERRGIGVTVVDPRWIIPVNPALPHLAARHRLAVTVEDACRVGGLGSALQAACADAAVTTSVRIVALPQEFIEHGDRTDLLAAAGLHAPGITQTVLHALAPTIRTPVQRPSLAAWASESERSQ
jgi:1-deoxy-D-xylulose-5-phosphate synthase